MRLGCKSVLSMPCHRCCGRPCPSFCHSRREPAVVVPLSQTTAAGTFPSTNGLTSQHHLESPCAIRCSPSLPPSSPSPPSRSPNPPGHHRRPHTLPAHAQRLLTPLLNSRSPASPSTKMASASSSTPPRHRRRGCRHRLHQRPAQRRPAVAHRHRPRRRTHLRRRLQLHHTARSAAQGPAPGARRSAHLHRLL